MNVRRAMLMMAALHTAVLTLSEEKQNIRGRTPARGRARINWNQELRDKNITNFNPSSEHNFPPITL